VYWTIQNNLVNAANPIAPREAIRTGAQLPCALLLVTGPLWWGECEGPARVERLARSVLLAGAWRRAWRPRSWVPFLPPLFRSALSAAGDCGEPVADAGLQCPRARASRAFFGWTVSVVVGFMVANAALYHPGSQVYRERSPVFRLVGERLRGDPCAPGPLFVWGYAPMFYYYADLPAASRFVVLAQARVTPYVSGNVSSVEGEGPAARSRRIIGSCSCRTRRPPGHLIVDTAPAGIFRWNTIAGEVPRASTSTSGHFELVGDVHRVRIYRRKQCRAA